jgi:hypothetical protein
LWLAGIKDEAIEEFQRITRTITPGHCEVLTPITSIWIALWRN